MFFGNLAYNRNFQSKYDPKGQENEIYTIVKGREMFYRRHTVPVTSCSEVKYVHKRVSFGSKDCTKELKLECAFSWARLASFCNLSFISDPLIVYQVRLRERWLTSRGLPSHSTCVLEAKSSKLDIKRGEPGILFISLPS